MPAPSPPLLAANKYASPPKNRGARCNHLPRSRFCFPRRRYRDRRRHRALPCRNGAVRRLAADALDQGSGVAASRPLLRCRVRPTRSTATREDPGLGGDQSGGAAADDVLHVLRAGFPLRRRVLLQGNDLCIERTRAARLGARSHPIAARRRWRCALQCRAFAQFDPELQLLHHQADEGRLARGANGRHLADPLRIPGAFGKNHPRSGTGCA